jgi:two-component system response regulator
MSFREQASGWRLSCASLTVTAGRYGQKARLGWGQYSTSRFRKNDEEEKMMDGKILLVEDNPDDVELTLRAFRQNNILNDVIIAKDGAEALDYLTATGVYAGRDVLDLPVVVLLDLKLPRIDGLEVLKQIRTNEITRLLPIVILTSSNQEQDVVAGYKFGANSYVRKPVDFVKFIDAIRSLGLYWLIWNEPVPKQAM